MCVDERERERERKVVKDLAEAVENVRARDDDVGRLEENKLLPENPFSALNNLPLSLHLLFLAAAYTQLELVEAQI